MTRLQFDASLSLAALGAVLSSSEMVHGRLGALGNDSGRTVATFADQPAPSGALELVADPDRNPVPAGRELVCVGRVYVEGRLADVAAVRRAADHRAGDAGDRERPAVSASRRSGASSSKRRAASGRNPRSGVSLAGAAGSRRHSGGEGKPTSPTRAAKAAGKARGSARPATRARAEGPPARAAGPAAEPMPTLEPREYRVWFGTNRKPVDPGDIAKGFSAERDRTVRYGYCDVYVPLSHKMGSIGSSAVIRWIRGADDRLRIRRLAGLAGNAFWAGLSRQLEQRAPGERDALVFIHGYRTTFRDSALRAAQIGFDLGIEGAMGFFSWPSRGNLLGYVADGSAIEGSERAIADFLVDFASHSGAERVHVIAHSMGNRGLLRAANRIVADAEARSRCRFGQFILAAPDVDSGSFLDLADAYKALARRTTLYVSSKDLAVQLARWISDYARVGFHPPVTVVEGIDTISVANVDLTLLGHGYVAEARDVLQDMEKLIRTNQPPPRFGHEEKRTQEGGRYWQVRA